MDPAAMKAAKLGIQMELDKENTDTKKAVSAASVVDLLPWAAPRLLNLDPDAIDADDTDNNAAYEEMLEELSDVEFRETARCNAWHEKRPFAPRVNDKSLLRSSAKCKRPPIAVGESTVQYTLDARRFIEESESDSYVPDNPAPARK